jgi:hypothetical protein
VADVLVFVQDPGAANFVVDLPDALAERGIGCRVEAIGAAAAHLGVPAAPVDAVADLDALLEDAHPSVIVVGTAEDLDTPALPLVDAARRRGVPSVGVVDGPANAAHRFRGRASAPLAHAPDWLLLADEWTRQEYVALGYPADRAIVTGHPLHDRVRAVGGQHRRHRDPTSPFVLLFAAERSTGLDPGQFEASEEYTLRGRGSSVGRTQIVMEELLDAVAALPERIVTVLRLHPKNTREELAPHLAEFDRVSGGGPTAEAVLAADGVVGMTSILLEEAVLLGRPTLSIVPRAIERAASASTRLGLTPCASTRADVRQAVAEMVRAPTVPPAAVVDAAFPRGGLRRAADVIAELAAGR